MNFLDILNLHQLESNTFLCSYINDYKKGRYIISITAHSVQDINTVFKFRDSFKEKFNPKFLNFLKMWKVVMLNWVLMQKCVCIENWNLIWRVEMYLKDQNLVILLSSNYFFALDKENNVILVWQFDWELFFDLNYVYVNVLSLFFEQNLHI